LAWERSGQPEEREHGVIEPGHGPNVMLETGAFTVTGGTGAFKGATGKGDFSWSVLSSPQTGSGKLTASVSY
jgi:hypothetical protein